MWAMCKRHCGRFAAPLRSATPRRFRDFLSDDKGVSIVVVALLLPALIGAMGLAVEISYWQLHHRAMQNAADAAAIAAATSPGSNYAAVATAVAAQYDFTNGVKNVVVSTSNPSSAAGCTANCYVVTITDQVPLFLSQVVGYTGSARVNNQPVTTLSATAVASTEGSTPICLLALASSGAQGISSNGAPKANMNGCNIMSNTGASCSGHNLGATTGFAHGTNSGCGVTQTSNVPVVSDPYSGLASNIPADTCAGSYPQEPSLPAQNKWSSLPSGVQVVCGDQQLSGNATLNNTTLVIENGQLDTNGNTLTGTGLTVIFTGSNNTSYQHIPTGGGTVDIDPPTSGSWSGVALYQDPNLSTNVDVSYSGSSPTWNISGLVYLPHSSVTFSGAVKQSTSGGTCLVMVVDNVTIKGSGGIFANDNGCSAYSLTEPGGGGNRGTLVN